MFADIILPPLALTTLGLAALAGVWQVNRMRKLKRAGKPSALAADGDPNDKQP